MSDDLHLAHFKVIELAAALVADCKRADGDRIHPLAARLGDALFDLERVIGRASGIPAEDLWTQVWNVGPAKLREWAATLRDRAYGDVHCYTGQRAQMQAMAVWIDALSALADLEDDGSAELSDTEPPATADDTE